MQTNYHNNAVYQQQYNPSIGEGKASKLCIRSFCHTLVSLLPWRLIIWSESLPTHNGGKDGQQPKRCELSQGQHIQRILSSFVNVRLTCMCLQGTEIRSLRPLLCIFVILCHNRKHVVSSGIDIFLKNIQMEHLISDNLKREGRDWSVISPWSVRDEEPAPSLTWYRPRDKYI